ncbi:hypothetical protein [Streptomyces sp. NPDC002520]
MCGRSADGILGASATLTEQTRYVGALLVDVLGSIRRIVGAR